MKKISEKKIKKVFEMYFLATKLKNLPRTGWLYWGLDKNIRHESVAEHIYGCQMLAMAIFANVDTTGIDTQKVLSMLAVHEVEEIFIGDVTPYDGKRVETKKQDGFEAVQKFFKNAEKPEQFLALIAEFEARKTKEAKLAVEIDKFESCLQAKIYDDHFFCESMNQSILKEENIVRWKMAGYSKVSQFFCLRSEKNFDELFKQLSQRLQELDLKDYEH